MSKDYGVLLPDGIALRGLFVIDPTGAVRISTIHDLPIGRSVTETLRLVQGEYGVNERRGKRVGERRGKESGES